MRNRIFLLNIVPLIQKGQNPSKGQNQLLVTQLWMCFLPNEEESFCGHSKMNLQQAALTLVEFWQVVTKL